MSGDAPIRSSLELVTQESEQLAQSAQAQEEDQSSLNFLIFTDLRQATLPQTRKQVRSHVMRGVHRRRKREFPPGKNTKIVLDTSSLLNPPSSTGQQLPLVPQTGRISPRTLAAAQVDPFGIYPIPMNMRTHELFHHCRFQSLFIPSARTNVLAVMGDFCPMFKTMSKIGFFRTMTDVAGFLQILCTSASHMMRLRTSNSSSEEAIVLSTQAIQSVNTRLADPVLSVSDGLIAAILAFCCHSVSTPFRTVTITGLPTEQISDCQQDHV